MMVLGIVHSALIQSSALQGLSEQMPDPQKAYIKYYKPIILYYSVHMYVLRL